MTAPPPAAALQAASAEPAARHLQPSDLRAAAALATQATAGLVDLVEAMHERIARLPGWPAPADAGRTSGITGLVYRSVRGVTKLVGGSADALLGWLQPVLAPGTDAALPTPEREAVLAALNGVLGDHLAATGNPLATPMALRSGGRALPLEPAALAAALKAAGTPAGPRVLVLLHGLCMNDLQWQRNGHDHGAMLARDAGWTPLYLHCNTGLPIADNGRQLAALMQQLVQAWPQPIDRLALLGHSMGGLIARSAICAAEQDGMAWPRQLGDLVCLGTPHHGAPLERAGRGVDLLLGATPYAAPLARLGKLRSAGITDLRHGNATPLPAHVRCHAVAGVLGEAAASSGLKRHLKQQVLGDGLVPLDSALGRHADPAMALDFPPDRQCVAQGVGHLDLLCNAEVADALRRWLR
jgi:pimeloyl-ACP methyl ester carboxylesterase